MVFRLRPEASKSPKTANKTEKFLLCLTSELKKKIKSEAHKMFGDRKGSESIYVEMQMRIVLHMNVEGVEEK